MQTAKTLIRLGRCPGWSVFAGCTLILLVLSCRSSYVFMENWWKLSFNYHQIPSLSGLLSLLTTTFNDPKYNEPRHEKTGLPGVRPGKTQTGLLSYRDKLESWNFGFSKDRYSTIWEANNKGADQTAWMRRLICAFVVRIRHKQVLSWRGLNVSEVFATV